MENGKRLPGNMPTEKLPVPTVESELLVVVSVFDRPTVNPSDVEANQGRQMYPFAFKPNDSLVLSDSLPPVSI
jgi:hypothetical protein